MALNTDTISFLRHSVHIKFQKENKGYSKEQVQRTLAKLPPLADEIERLQNRVRDYETRAQSAEARLVEAQAPTEIVTPEIPSINQDFDETLRNTLVNAQRNADVTVREAQEEAERLRTEAEFQSNALLADARDQAAEMTREAEEAKLSFIGEAETERAKMLEDASTEVKGRLDSIEEELKEAHETERTNLLDQIADLKEKHKLLESDVTRFEEHLSNRREEVRKALTEITEVLDDPERLRVEDPIEPAADVIPEFVPEDYPPIAVTVQSVDDLDSEATAAMANIAPEESIDASEFDSLTVVEEEETEVFVEEDFTDTDVVYEQDETVDVPFADDEQFIDLEPEVAPEAQETSVKKDHSPPPPPPQKNSDPYLEELRRVTTEDPLGDDPIGDFLDDEDGKGTGWFGRRK